ncbi:MAG: radical SAM protein [Deltaproteobacteria bacterium]|nr:radical SAM protein [Deltaproteobacteria bacterium]
MKIQNLISKAHNREVLTRDELIFLLNFPPEAPESYQVMATANHISKELTNNRAEIHAQLALNMAPCPGDCAFCSFSGKNGVFSRETRLPPAEAISYAKGFEKAGANAIYLMTTATYPFELFLEISREIRDHLDPETILIANVGDQSLLGAQKLRAAGFTGVYHALRLREGVDSALSPEARKQSLRNFQEAGLQVGTCVEPIGPEHDAMELADLIAFTAAINPSYSGAARRIPIPGTEMAARGTISELRMAQIVAVTRLGMPRTVAGNCTHEPCTLGGIAGANLFWAEAGANPRDIREKTEEGRGESVASCRVLFRESGWETLEGPSRYFGR